MAGRTRFFLSSRAYNLATTLAVRVALIAVLAVVHVAGNALVMLISRGFGVAVRALEHRKIRRIDMAGGADPIGATVISREPRVVEGCSQPGSRVVAGLAGGWKSCADVVRVVRSLIVLLMTAITGRGQGGVVVVHVAVGTRNSGMGPGQWKRRVVVIKGGSCPRSSVMAGIAGLGKTAGNMVRIGCALEILKVASHAGAAGQPVIAIDVALRALQRAVRPGEGKSRRSVVEAGSQPGSGRVATVTRLGER